MGGGCAEGVAKAVVGWPQDGAVPLGAWMAHECLWLWAAEVWGLGCSYVRREGPWFSDRRRVGPEACRQM